jgi:hypothetical protein
MYQHQRLFGFPEIKPMRNGATLLVTASTSYTGTQTALLVQRQAWSIRLFFIFTSLA